MKNVPTRYMLVNLSDLMIFFQANKLPCKNHKHLLQNINTAIVVAKETELKSGLYSMEEKINSNNLEPS